MTDRAKELASKLIRNYHDVPLERLVREPLYDADGARLGTGTAAQKLGASIDVVAPGKISGPDGSRFSYVQRMENGLDYWDGEP